MKNEKEKKQNKFTTRAEWSRVSNLILVCVSPKLLRSGAPCHNYFRNDFRTTVHVEEDSVRTDALHILIIFIIRIERIVFNAIIVLFKRYAAVQSVRYDDNGVNIDTDENALNAVLSCSCATAVR